jgi:cyclic di-GMP phosphodiesterase Gmr
MTLSLYGKMSRFILSAVKSVNEWAGTASAWNDTLPWPRDLAQGLSFAEQVVSEATPSLLFSIRTAIFSVLTG